MKKTLLTSIALISFAISMDAVLASPKKGGNNNNSEESRNVRAPAPAQGIDDPEKKTLAKGPEQNKVLNPDKNWHPGFWDNPKTTQNEADQYYIKKLNKICTIKKNVETLMSRDVAALLDVKNQEIQWIRDGLKVVFDTIDHRLKELSRRHKAFLENIDNKDQNREKIAGYRDSDVREKFVKWNGIYTFLNLYSDRPRENSYASNNLYYIVNGNNAAILDLDKFTLDIKKAASSSSNNEDMLRRIAKEKVQLCLSNQLLEIRKYNNLTTWASKRREKWEERLSHEEQMKDLNAFLNRMKDK